MNHESNSHRQSSIDWTPRLNLLVGLTLVGATVITWRLLTKSVIEHPLYAAKAENQYEVSQELPSRRGTIYAQDTEAGKTVPLGATEERFDISVVPRNVSDPSLALTVLHDLFGLDPESMKATVSSSALYAPPLVYGVKKEQRDALVQRAFPGLLIGRRRVRVYPENQLAASVLGFVNREGKGNYGIEGYYDDQLRGKTGSVLGQKDTLGRLIATVAKVTPEDGADVELTLDHNVQFAVEDRLYRAVQETKAVSGQVIVMNPKTGAILALAATPAFDPNKYNELSKDEVDRFQNPTISSVYEPGSIMKPLVMSAVIDAGKIEPDTKETFGKSVTVQGYEINTALDKAYGEETMTQVLENSDNVGMVWVANHLSNEELRAAFVRYGLDSPTGIDLSGEINGKLLELGLWRDIHRATMAFGQGISASPMEMVRAWAALINGGDMVTPHVVASIQGQHGTIVTNEQPSTQGVISAETSRKVRGMLRSVIDHGPYSRTRVPGYAIGGKTGTAQIAAPGGGYLEDAFTHTLMGFFPVDNPQYLMLVKLDRPQEGKFAESTTGPVFHDLAQFLFSYYKLPPDTNPE